MTIQEILEAHRTLHVAHLTSAEVMCKCGALFSNEPQHRAHLAEVLDKHMQEREAEAWDRLVDYAPFTVFERVRLRCENPFREEPNDG